MTMTSGFIRDALAGLAKVIAADFDRKNILKSISTDSRTITSEDLFVALKGEVHDGHDFIAKAVERGCKSFVCEKFPAGVDVTGIDIYLVENSLEAFRKIALSWREVLGSKVVAVAGSVGKTTTKDLLAAILAEKWPDVLKTKGSQNGFIGIPMTLTQLTQSSEVAVIEVGIDAPGAMIQHIDVVRPDVAIVTAISEEHLEWLKDLKTIAYEENLILQETAKAEGVVVINLDDPWIAPLFESIQSNTKIGFTMTDKMGVNILNGKITNLQSNELQISGLGVKPFLIESPLPGEHNARNLLGAVAIAVSLGLKPEQIKSGLKKFKSSGGRSELERASNGAKVLCDFYNANPASMRAAFQVVKNSSRDAENIWLCLGDMKELGTEEETLHRSLALDLGKLTEKKSNVLLYGDKMKWLFEELKKFKNPNLFAKHFEDQAELGRELQQKMSPSDFVLIKGSRSMAMEKIWENFLK